MNSWDDLREAIVVGAVKRLRPKVMTVACMLFGLLPIMWSVGTGGDVMKRIATPMIGGIITSFLMELIFYPPVFAIWKWNFELKAQLKQQGPKPLEPTNIQKPVHAGRGNDLPYAVASFDRVFSSFMFHHLPPDEKAER